MFKRVDRRLKRKEEEERLGLDDDEREVLGLHHTDSSESESDSPSSSSASTSSSLEQTSTGHGAPSVNKRKRRASSHSRSENEEDEELGSDHEIDSPLTVASALNEPVQLIRSYPEAWVCVFCPNKILKHAAMVKVHEASRIHQHRFKRIQELASGFSPHEDIRTLLLKSTVESQPPLSRRAEQKKYRQVKLKERRNRVKEKKAAAMAPANVEKGAKTADTRTIQELALVTDEAVRPTKRLEAALSRASVESPSMHNTTPQVGVKKRNSAARQSRETTKSHVPGKRKRKVQRDDGSTPTKGRDV